MDTFIAKSGRQYFPLAIDNAQGFPQSFPFLFNGQTYHFRLYVNIAASLLNDAKAFLELPMKQAFPTDTFFPTERAFLVVQVERESDARNRETIFLRKVIPDLEYAVENIILTFPTQRIARSNLNGQGDFGTQVIGGIAERWA